MHPAAVIDTDPRLIAFMARDIAADGTFVAAVRTTGIYCRASCPARRPKPENVSFYASAVDAARDGFRACKRCWPDGPSRRTAIDTAVIAACRTLSEAETPPRLADLARAAGLSPFHFHRVFRAVTGLTPKAYAVAARARRMRAALDADDLSITAAIYEAGYGSNGRFYAAAREVLGMTPTTYRNGGRDLVIHFAVSPCTLGQVLAAASPTGLCAILLGDSADGLAADLRNLFPQAVLKENDPDFAALLAAAVTLIEDPRRSTALPLDVAGTVFQRRVWDALRAIPPGRTMSYGEVAAAIGQPTAVRAVARACAANTLAVAIPCHRVVHGSGKASGYRWGPERKRVLLAREAEAVGDAEQNPENDPHTGPASVRRGKDRG